MVVITPERSVDQRLAALQSANRIRAFRAQKKREIKRREVPVTTLLLDVPAEMETMKVFDLLRATPKIGRTKADRILRRERVSPSKTIGGLSERQRLALAAALAPYARSVRTGGTMES